MHISGQTCVRKILMPHHPMIYSVFAKYVTKKWKLGSEKKITPLNSNFCESYKICSDSMPDTLEIHSKRNRLALILPPLKSMQVLPLTLVGAALGCWLDGKLITLKTRKPSQ